MTAARRCSLVVILSVLYLGESGSAAAALLGYWPLEETSGTVAPNLVPGGTPGTLTNGPTWTSDPERGQVLSFDGSDDFVDAGMLPALATTDNFTWSFWTNQVSGGSGANDVALGNRYNAAGGSDGHWIKFTPTNFEYQPGTPHINYVDIPDNQWVHHTVVKSRNTLTYFRNGVPGGTTTAVNNVNAVPFYIGGDKYAERWSGRIDDVAIWNSTLTPRMVELLAAGVSPLATQPTDDFTADTINPGRWQVIDYGLESPRMYGATMATLVADTTTNPDQLTLGGQSSTTCCWAGATVRSVDTFDTRLTTLISVDRVSLAGAGHPYRSSLWIWGDDNHYLHFSHNVGETGWSWNANDVGGVGTLNPAGGGNNLSVFDALDGQLGLMQMQLVWIPNGPPGSGKIEIYLNGLLGATHTVSNFPSQFRVMLSGMPWGDSSTVAAVFDNFSVLSVPEPATLWLAALAGLGLLLVRKIAC